MSTELIAEARRQVEICNACRYCEGYCAVFPAITRQRAFADGDITQLANLCHNCRGCYYACQYTEPHEFALNLPKALAEVRQASWQDHAWPRGFARLYDRNGVVIAALLVVAIALLFALAQAFRPETGEGFYAYMSHGLMVAVFAPAFVLPLAAIAVSLRGYWRSVGGGAVSLTDLWAALRSAGRMDNLSGGHGEGCNFEDADRFSNARRGFHHAVLYGFLLCFASTSTATLMHYLLGLEAPYGPFSLPKLLGVPGGVLLCLGTAGLAWLKLKADPELGAPKVWGGEMAFVALLFAVSATGLVLYAATGSAAVGWLLPLHLGTVLTFFLLIPFSKMAHGFYRLAALVRDQTERG
ncbi:tricarballylate utilization 4Fe-4S protein TcuB [Aestuariicoccus sp. MJ-SS9]|uniref:tricarballylate utilization 4Fe-4S protein TcuB n=1 Tax=Aestuariicoccus sp. MJ-SS9 TaxID=3079855 RepID=UPI00290D3552|nr:tricarballylate utilization 4Fe-4S protein TcuB [Aestuariicoccus sp. MJ-SS9]MDU8909777.1 tricarballylate utilization 4Fe-4S protein TcuB [Aestuariicoccus sp. MJ-SS9]